MMPCSRGKSQPSKQPKAASGPNQGLEGRLRCFLRVVVIGAPTLGDFVGVAIAGQAAA